MKRIQQLVRITVAAVAVSGLALVGHVEKAYGIDYVSATNTTTATIAVTISLGSSITMRLIAANYADNAAGANTTNLTAGPDIVSAANFDATCGGAETGANCVPAGLNAWAVTAFSVNMVYAGCPATSGHITVDYNTADGKIANGDIKICEDSIAGQHAADIAATFDCAAGGWAAGSPTTITSGTPASVDINLPSDATLVLASATKSFEVGVLVTPTDTVSLAYNMVVVGSCL